MREAFTTLSATAPFVRECKREDCATFVAVRMEPLLPTRAASTSTLPAPPPVGELALELLSWTCRRRRLAFLPAPEAAAAAALTWPPPSELLRSLPGRLTAEPLVRSAWHSSSLPLLEVASLPSLELLQCSRGGRLAARAAAPELCNSPLLLLLPVSYTHLTLPTIYSV
eukprot:TRINITY_DN131_c1_g1_i5.p2 TRINITY_DN131_c1_g1~~TRINITY_DN131_c1_g1_i5.p2  ORF type:complete len:169 (-),score=33.96 TRINITY_DN131_c1_g1_i5:81-587(-)